MAIKGYSTTIKYGTSGGSPTTLLGQVMDVTAPDQSVDDVEFTNNDSANGFKEYIPGLSDGGTVSFEVVYEESKNATMQTLLGAMKSWEITLPDDSTWDFEGYVNGLGHDVPVGDLVKNSVSIKIDGKPSFSAVSI